MNTQEILSPKVVYHDEDGAVYLTVGMDRLWLHVQLYHKMTHKLIRKAWDVLDALEDNLKSRGFKRYYTASDSASTARFVGKFGFHPTDELLDINGIQFDIMSKDL